MESLSGRSFGAANQDYLDFVRTMRSGGPMHPYDLVQGPVLRNPFGFLDGDPAITFGNQWSFHTQSAVDLLYGGLQ